MAKRRQGGFTLIELMVAIFILMLLTGLAVPMARSAIKRQKERELRQDLREMRDAIDRYKDAADRLLLREKGDDTGYPKTLDILVKGVEINGGKTVRFLHDIPVDPMTGKAEWVCTPWKTILGRIRGIRRSCLMCFRRPRGLGWMGRSIGIGRVGLVFQFLVWQIKPSQLTCG